MALPSISFWNGSSEAKYSGAASRVRSAGTAMRPRTLPLTWNAISTVALTSFSGSQTG
jgi:hypothetical protein